MDRDSHIIRRDADDSTELEQPRSPFDSAASSYDRMFSHTALGMRKRSIVRKYVIPLLNQDYNVLELNCGTGEDAVWMARRVRRVVATDLSANMTHLASLKARDGGLRNVETAALDMSLISKESAESLNRQLQGPFDLIFSDFDGLNCIRNPQPVFEGIGSLLSETGHIVFVFMSSFCLMQSIISTISRGDQRSMMRGRNSEREIPVGPDSFVTTYFHSIDRVKQDLRETGFKVRSIRGVGLTTPPTTVGNFYERHRRLFRLLNPLEDALSPIPPFSRMCDHVLVHAQKVD